MRTHPAMPRRPDRRFAAAVAALVGLSAVAACATAPPGVTPAFLAVELAAKGPPAALLQRAEAGDALSQLAWSLVLDRGLHGVPVDPAAADRFQALATASRGETQVLQYIPAFGDQPARTYVSNVPRRALTGADAALAEQCASAVASGASSDSQLARACGPGTDYARLRSLWPS
jgi:hypothetical protein